MAASNLQLIAGGADVEMEAIFQHSTEDWLTYEEVEALFLRQLAVNPHPYNLTPGRFGPGPPFLEGLYFYHSARFSDRYHWTPVNGARRVNCAWEELGENVGYTVATLDPEDGGGLFVRRTHHHDDDQYMALVHYRREPVAEDEDEDEDEDEEEEEEAAEAEAEEEAAAEPEDGESSSDESVDDLINDPSYEPPVRVRFHALTGKAIQVERLRTVTPLSFLHVPVQSGSPMFQKALELLYNVVTTAPMHLVTATALEASTKYTLVTLIQSGQFFGIGLPKCASKAAKSNFKTCCTPYVEAGNCYNDGKISELEAVVVATSSDFEKAGEKAMTCGVTNVGETTVLHVLQMIQDGQIHALINQKDGMVKFLEDPEHYKTRTSEMIEITDPVIQRTIGLSKNLIAMDESLSYDPLHLGKVPGSSGKGKA